MADRKRVCCNCGRNKRIKDEDTGVVECICAIDGHRIGYVECFEHWCPRWCKDRTFEADGGKAPPELNEGAEIRKSITAGDLPQGLEALFSEFAEKVRGLTAAERRIFDCYVGGCEISDIPKMAYISIHTVKKHNRSIYHKLGVGSRGELVLYVELFRRAGRLQDLT